MMLKELSKSTNYLKKDKTIFDVVLYGSSVKGKDDFNDIDIALIFNQGTLKERLEKIQELKKNLSVDKKLDIQSFLLIDLFSKNFFGRSGIFLEGVSLFDEKPFSKKIGYKSYSIFNYNLKDKTHTEKVKFNYLLAGRNTEGIIKMMEGKHFSSGVIQIPIKNSLKFEEILINNKIDYAKNNILEQI
jgi:predicted nucleotidyltransferase